jgi:signal transduction histidine kinase
VTEKIAAEYALNAKPVETRLQPQLPSSTSGFNAPVVAVPASFQDFIALGRHYIPRVTDNRLSLLLYGRDPDVPDRIVGCEVNLDELKSRLQRRLAARGWASDWCAAILDDTLRPVALSLENFTTDFRRPLVSEPLTEALPHWEAAVYSTRPAQLADAARWVSWTVALSVLTCLLVIFIGSLLVWRETARERRLAQQKADFVTNVTHELQTPLANIRLFSEMLGGDAPAEKQRQYSGVLLAETDRLARLINNVLDFAKGGEQRRQTDNCQWIDAGALVREIVETQRPRLENSGFKLTTDFPDASLTIHADREAVTRALVNLISNAEKYGGDPKEIRVTVRQVGNQVEVAVLDRGIGVPAAEREKIFEPFYRAHDQLNSGTSGTGLGLTLARRIARDHGGELRHEPREGGGSVFVLSLPLV